jgi:hypothetical protein
MKHKRHPLEVTSDRLAEHVERHYESTTGGVRDAVSRVRDWLELTAEQESSPKPKRKPR